MDLEMDLETAAREARGNWQKFDCFAWHDRPEDSAEWAIIYTHNRDSDLLDQSNADAIDKALAPFLEGPDVRAEHHGHWACGWIDGYAIRVYRNGQITEAFRAYHELAARLADYPVLDEEDFSRREYDATLENLRSEGFDSDFFAPPDNWETEVFSWLWDHNQSAVENRDGNGGYASKAEIAEALDGLGYRILWVVSYVDTGEVREEYREESEAQERCEALRADGVLGATYCEQLPTYEESNNDANTAT
jgi:hypothetical protein